MTIDIVVNEVFNGWEPTDIRLGGTEESVVEWMRELRRREHETTLYHNKRRYDYKGQGDVCLNIKSPDIPRLKPTIYFTNETDAGTHDLSQYDAVAWPSQWAADNIKTNAKKTIVIPHGYNPEKIFPGKKLRYQCFYASSPDRGLDTLLNIWPGIHAKHPDAILIVTYGAKTPNLPGLFNLGEVDEQTMNEIYQTSDFWCHPLNNSMSELFCMTGKKAQISGCVPIIIPRAALKETVISGYFAEDESSYADVLDKALSSSDRDIKLLRKEVIKNANALSWENSTDILLDFIDQLS
jgi:glycosyltransferase involved in cell wall biosynthesis